MPGAPVVNLPANGNNSRIAHIRKFCALPPERGLRLVLRTDEDVPRPLGEWMRSECENSASVPVAVDEALADHARSTRAAVKAELEWLDEDGARVTFKTLRHAAIIDPAEQGDEFDQMGPPRSEIEAGNRAFARTLIAANQTALNSLASTIDRQNHHIARQQEQVHARDLEIERMRLAHRRELERVERERAEAAAAIGEGEVTPHGELMAMLRDGLTSLVPALLQGPAGQAIAALLVGQQGGAAPAQPRTLPSPAGPSPAVQPTREAPPAPAPAEPPADAPPEPSPASEPAP